MKNSKPIHLFSSLLFMLCTLLFVACGDVAEQAGDAVDSAASKIEDAASKVGDAASKAGDAIADGASKVIGDQEIHIFPRSEEFIDFAHFGHYDFEDFEMKDGGESTEGNAKVKKTIYEKEHMSITYIDKDMGDDGYSHTHSITNSEGKETKKRVFSFLTKPELKVVEQIYDYEANHLWSREKKMKVHFEKMDEKPEVMLLEPFKQSDIN